MLFWIPSKTNYTVFQNALTSRGKIRVRTQRGHRQPTCIPEDALHSRLSRASIKQRNVYICGSNSKDINLEIDTCANLIDEMMEGMLKKLFVATSTNYVTDEKPKKEEIEEMLDQVVGPKLDELPGITLSMLDSFIDASQRDDASVETTQLLVLIKQYIIQKLSEKLPADMKALQGIVDADRIERMEMYELLRTKSDSPTPGQQNGGNESANSKASLEQVAGACDGLIRNLERGEGIKDFPFLARLCIVRAELRQVMQYDNPVDATDSNSMNAFMHMQQVPEKDASIIKELLNISDSRKRIALIRSFVESGAKEKPEQGLAVSPGMFLDSIGAIRQEVVKEENASARVIQRLDDIEQEILQVLEDIISSDFRP